MISGVPMHINTSARKENVSLTNSFNDFVLSYFRAALNISVP